jgi:hypothetical protein
MTGIAAHHVSRGNQAASCIPKGNDRAARTERCRRSRFVAKVATRAHTEFAILFAILEGAHVEQTTAGYRRSRS